MKRIRTEEEILRDQIRALKLQKKSKIFFFSKEHFNARSVGGDHLYYPIRPNPIQEKLIEAWGDPENKVFVYSGGNRSGKTTIGIVLILSTMFGFFPWDRHKKRINPTPAKIRWVGQDWEKHISTVLIPAIKEWWPATRRVKTKKNNFSIPAFWLDEITGSTLEIMSNKSESELFEGWDGHLVVYDEPPKQAVRTACARGLVDHEGRELFTMTLLKEPWIHQEVINARLPDGRPDPTIFSCLGTIYDNVGFGITNKGIEQFAKTLKDSEREARLYGKPSYMSGLVLPQFKRQKHLIKRFKVPLDWMVDILIDVHPRERQAVLFIATDPKNYRYCIDEIWEHGNGTRIAEEIMRYVTRNCYRVNRVAIDPLSKSDSNSPETTYGQIATVLGRYGLQLEVASKDKTSGILEIQEHLEGPNGEPSIFFFDDLRKTILEIEGWMFDEETQNPRKKDDHFMENLYRALLLGTQWHSYRENREEYMDLQDRPTIEQVGRNPVTGY